MLSRLAGITDLTRARPLLQVLLKLFRLCVKVKRNQEVLTQPELNAIAVFLNVLKELCESKESNASQAAITEQLLHVRIESSALVRRRNSYPRCIGTQNFFDIGHLKK